MIIDPEFFLFWSIDGLRSVMCTYRSLFTFVNFKLLERSLSEIGHMDFDMNADNADESGAQQEIAKDINDYRDLFAEDYCRNLKVDL